MFDFAWSEIALIGVVALVAIGPKDMPVAVKTLSDLVKKARRMAGEFQTHVDEMVRDANLHDVRDHINDIRSLNLRSTIARAVDGDGSIRRAFTENPLAPTVSPPAGAVAQPPSVIGLPDATAAQASIASLTPPGAIPGAGSVGLLGGSGHAGAPGMAAAPAFIPPAAATAAMPAPSAPVPPPAFIPPAAALVPAEPAAATPATAGPTVPAPMMPTAPAPMTPVASERAGDRHAEALAAAGAQAGSDMADASPG